MRSGAALLGRSLRPRGASPGAGLLALATNEVMCSFFFILAFQNFFKAVFCIKNGCAYIK